MGKQLNRLIDRLSEFLAARKGLLPMLGVALVVVNWLLRILSADGWLAQTDFFLHLGVILAILGMMVAWAL